MTAPKSFATLPKYFQIGYRITSKPGYCDSELRESANPTKNSEDKVLPDRQTCG